MPYFTYDQVSIHYEIHGTGFPVLLFAPGGMRSAIPYWESSPWNPIDALSDEFTVIAMDQRNAGKSTAPVSRHDGWPSYTQDHLRLLRHLGFEQTHILGGCIGGPFGLGIMSAEPERVACAVLQQPIGCYGNRDLFYEMFDGWSEDLKPIHPEASESHWLKYRTNMFDQDFIFAMDQIAVRAIATPILVLMGNDPYHPESISRELATLAPNASLIEDWKDPEADQTVSKVKAFLRAHTPGR